MKKYICILLLVIAASLFCGCGSQSYFLTVNNDDTSDFSVSVTVDKDTYSLLSSYGIDSDKLNRQKITTSGTSIDDIDALFQEAAAIFQEYGFETEPVNDSVEIGFSAKKTYSSIEELNAEIKELYDKEVIGLTIEVTKYSSKFKTQYSMTGELRYVLDPDVDLEDEQNAEIFNSVFDQSNLIADFTAVFPSSTSIADTDGVTSSNGAGATWSIKYTDEAESTAINNISSYTNSSMYAVAFIAVVIIAAALVMLLRRLIRRRKEKNDE